MIDLTPEEGGLHGEIVDTPESRAFFKRLSEIAKVRETPMSLAVMRPRQS